MLGRIRKEEDEEESTAISIPARVCARTVFRADELTAKEGRWGERSEDERGNKGVAHAAVRPSVGLGWLSSYQSELLNPPVPRAISHGHTYEYIMCA